MAATFLTPDELVALTGRKRKDKQLEALRLMRVPFLVNAAGRPVVTRTSIEGGQKKQEATGWMPGGR